MVRAVWLARLRRLTAGEQIMKRLLLAVGAVVALLSLGRVGLAQQAPAGVAKQSAGAVLADALQSAESLTRRHSWWGALRW